MFTATTKTAYQKLGSYSIYSGVTITVEKGAAFDQAHRTANHLASTLHMLTSADLDDSVKESLWMLTYMAQEVVALLPLVVQDSCIGKS